MLASEGIEFDRFRLNWFCRLGKESSAGESLRVSIREQ